MTYWKTLSQKRVYSNPYFSIREDKVVRPNGKSSSYYIVDKHESVFILPMNSLKEVCLIKQFRYPTNTWSWEVPAGSTDGQEPLIAAQRELQEETGLIANSWEEIAKFPIGAGLSNNIGHIFIAKDIISIGENRQEEEGIVDCQYFSIDIIKKMLISGEMQDGPSISALAIAFWR